MKIPHAAPDFIGKFGQYIQSANTFSPWALIIGAATVLIIVLIRKFLPRVPAAVVAVFGMTAVVYFLKIPVETIADRYGAMPNTLPSPHLPAVNFDTIRRLVNPALTIAMLAAIESLLSAVVADGMTGDKHSSNQELIAQGLGNVVSGLFGGIPATGAIARTAANIKNGGQSPISSIIHAGVLLLFVLFLSPLASAIPLTTLAAVLIVVSYDMSDFKRFSRMVKAPKSDFFVMLATFALTVIVDLTVAVEVGVVCAVFLFIKRMSDTSSIGKLSLDEVSEARLPSDDPDATNKKVLPAGCEVFELSGPLFFGVTDLLDETIFQFEKKPKCFILRMRTVPAIDASGLKALSDFNQKCKRAKVRLILSGVQEQPMGAIRKLGLDKDIGEENIFDHIDKAVARAWEVAGAKETPKEERA
jgi:SulP family sulfate permease